MDLNEYLNLWIQYRNNLSEEVLDSINEQNKLSKIANELAYKRYKLEDYSNNLLNIGTDKFLEKYPEYKTDKEEPKIEVIKNILNEIKDNSTILKEKIDRMNEIPELKENNELQDELMKATYDHQKAAIELMSKINEDRKKLFSSEYLEKMNELADNGVLLYFLETPDFPLLEKGVNEELIIYSLTFNDCFNLKQIIYSYVNINYKTNVTVRKIEDLETTVDLIINEKYRSAAKNLFALLDNDHKRCADSFEGFYEKVKIYKKGYERALKIDSLVNIINNDWIINAWNKTNSYYKKVTSTKPIEGVIHRNSIVHGDYENSLVDVTKYDCVKLLLLWVNLKVITEYIKYVEDINTNFISYIYGYAKENEKQSDNK